MFQEFLNEVSFAILLHKSHCSYPNRRRACFDQKCFENQHFLALKIFWVLKWPYYHKANKVSKGVFVPLPSIVLNRVKEFQAENGFGSFFNLVKSKYSTWGILFKEYLPSLVVMTHNMLYVSFIFSLQRVMVGSH